MLALLSRRTAAFVLLPVATQRSRFFHHSLPLHVVKVTSTTFSVRDEDTTSSRQKKKKPLAMPDQEQETKLSELQHAVRIHHSHGNYSEALTTAQSVLELSMEHFGRDHPSTASAFNNVGLMHKLLGNYKEARNNYHDALRVYGDVCGKDHSSYAASLHNIAVLNTSQCHLDESLTQMERLTLNEQALEYAEDAWTIRRAELGPTHPLTLASQTHLGSSLADMVLQQASRSSGSKTKMTERRWEQAEDHLRQAMNTAISNPRGKAIEDTSRQKITTLFAAAAAQSLAVFLKAKATVDEHSKDEDGLAEAKALYDQILLVRNELLEPLHPDIVATKFSMAELLQALGQEDEANTIRQELMDDYGVTEVEEVDPSSDDTSNIK
jgi:tetratricopeptide (TPR) repeat protein